jgi:hypothetical protein
MTMNVSHLRHITSILHPSSPVANDIADEDIADEDIAFHLRSVPLPLNTPLTPEELAYNEKYTRRKLKLLPTWPLWKTAEKQQLDKMNLQGMFGSPTVPPPNAVLLHSLWRCTYKDGVRKAQ